MPIILFARLSGINVTLGSSSAEILQMKLSTKSLLAVSVAVLSGGALAHHSFAMFDNQVDMVLEGTVREFQWTNPHTWIQLMVKDAAGKEVEWSLEGQSPNGLVRQGWARSSVKAGDKATVVIHPLKDGSAGGSVVRVTIDGQAIGRPAGPPPGANGEPPRAPAQ